MKGNSDERTTFYGNGIVLSYMSSQPNILIILTDQQSSKMMSCAGNRYVNTPSLDALANQGVRFTRCVCTNPVCVPSRFSLFTGLLPSAISIRCNEDARDIPKVSKDILHKSMGHLFKKAGYGTYYGGKEHLPTFNAKEMGFTYYCKDERDDLARESAEFLKRKHDTPFLLVVSFINPHDICYMAINDYKQAQKSNRNLLQKIFGKYDPWFKKIELQNMIRFMSEGRKDAKRDEIPPLPDNHEPQEEEPEAVRSLFKRKFRQHIREKWDSRMWQLHRYVYAKLTEKVDGQIGEVLQALKEGPNSENTAVIFTSDHGDHDASHKLEHKTALYTEAVEVPFIISWKGTIPEGKTVSKVISNGLDLLPTVCSMANIECPQNLEGKSVLNLITGELKELRKWAPIESEVGGALWNDKWAYCLYNEGLHREQLYNFERDSGQTKNHIREHPEILKECREEWSKRC